MIPKKEIKKIIELEFAVKPPAEKAALILFMKDIKEGELQDIGLEDTVRMSVQNELRKLWKERDKNGKL